MSKAYVFFIRHGQTDWNLLKKTQGRDEIPLNETGIEQARHAAYGIKQACLNTGFKFDAVIASPLSRASITGKIIANELACERFYTDDGVIERDFGVLSGTTYTPDSVAITEDCEVEGLERKATILKRVNDFLKRNIKEGERVLVVSHGSVSKIFAKSVKKAPHVTNFDELLGNCSMVVYSYENEEVLMEGYNISPDKLEDFILERLEK